MLPASKAAADITTNTLLNARPEEVWLEIMTYGQYESFGESAALQEGVRGASIITNMFTELLVLTKHDMLQNISAAAREKLEELIKERTSDHDLMRYSLTMLPSWLSACYDHVLLITWHANLLQCCCAACHAEVKTVARPKALRSLCVLNSDSR